MFIKLILFSLTLSSFIIACSVSEPSSVADQGTAVPEELPPVTETSMPNPTATSSPTATATAKPEPEVQEVGASPTAIEQILSEEEPTEFVIQPGVENLSIAGAGDLPLQATIYTPGGSGPLPGVILLHMLGSDRQVWDDNSFANTLVENGYAVLAVDMRGHGETGDSIDWQLAPEDLQHVWAYFTSLGTVDPQHTAVIGASIGANLALRTGAAQPLIRTVILLSPGLDYRGVTTEDHLQKYGARPILIVASEEDTYAVESSRTLAGLAQGESQLEIYTGAGHGTRMFNAKPELPGLIITWLAQFLN